MKHQKLWLALALSTLGAQAIAQTPPPTPAKSPETLCLVPAGQLIGKSVLGPSEDSRGEIGDIVVDAQSGQMHYAVLEVGGFIGIGEENRVVPWSSLQVQREPGDSNKLRVGTSLTAEQVKAAPKFKGDKAFDAETVRLVEASFGKDKMARPASATPTFVLTSALDEVKLAEASGADVGKVHSVILAPQEGRVAYAVIDTNKEAGGKDIAMPFKQLHYTITPEGALAATTKVQLDQLRSAPEFDSKDMKRMCSPQWIHELCTYYHCENCFPKARGSSTP